MFGLSLDPRNPAKAITDNEWMDDGKTLDNQ